MKRASSQSVFSVEWRRFLPVYLCSFPLAAAAINSFSAGNLGNVEGAGGHKLTSYAIAEYFLSKRTELYAEVDRNGFSGAYRYDPANIAALGLNPGGHSLIGASVGLMTRF